jgi:carboxylesterase type B
VRSLPEQAILDASEKLVNQMPSTGGGGVLGPVIGYGPAPDGKSIPDLPLAQFHAGEFHEELEGIIMGSMAYEGMGTSHDTDQPEYFPTMVRQIMPNASDEVVSTIQTLYYHPETPAQLAWDWTTDAIFSCNSYNLANALPGKSRRYVMSTPPATHGQDLWCKFHPSLPFSPGLTTLPHLDFFYVDEEQTPLGEEGVGLAREFQTKLLDFVHGDDVAWPLYGPEKNIFNITDRFEEATWAPDLTKRCDTINRFVLDPANGA